MVVCCGVVMWMWCGVGCEDLCEFVEVLESFLGVLWRVFWVIAAPDRNGRLQPPLVRGEGDSLSAKVHLPPSVRTFLPDRLEFQAGSAW